MIADRKQSALHRPPTGARRRRLEQHLSQTAAGSCSTAGLVSKTPPQCGRLFCDPVRGRPSLDMIAVGSPTPFAEWSPGLMAGAVTDDVRLPQSNYCRGGEWGCRCPAHQSAPDHRLQQSDELQLPPRPRHSDITALMQIRRQETRIFITRRVYAKVSED